jgi:hypothetical protein
MYLDRTNSAPGQNFHFDLILFDMDPDTIGHLVETFGELAREGLGRGRGKLELSTASYPDELPEPEAVIYETDSLNL